MAKTRIDTYHRKVSKHAMQADTGVVIKDIVFDEFIRVCVQAQAPNQALLDAAKLTDNRGIK